MPAQDVDRVTVVGIPNGRFYPNLDAGALAAEVKAAHEREVAWYRSEGHKGPLPPAYLLAISGGGDDGAFGAGLLTGWTKRGDRPKFKLVTGVSTGALTAPFAFLGPEYDDALTEVYTRISPDSIFTKRSFFAAFTSDGLSDNAPLYRTVSKYLTMDMMGRIAVEYDRGRLLLIASTQFDAARTVIWNVGAIAKTGTPEALELIRRLLVASAAVPGAFPPTMIDVEVNGKKYQEMHVDGGAMAQVFLYPPTVSLKAIDNAEHFQRKRVAYVIRNSKLSAPWEDVPRHTLTIVGRAVSMLLASDGAGDMYRIYAESKRDGVDLNIAYIDTDFTAAYVGPFDPAYMVPLYQYGHDLGQRGYTWKKVPPGFASPP
ncbi:patatin-like phospholipase family protein [Vineibacter terrae]|uniref:patatin-like phospholipase family protein n=1 Tax=Vineibacter terrae TaxID=2586908 RepID=UPI0015B55A0D|nr:patatin-like phospholipase family protein [Vineibacter terrae]